MASPAAGPNVKVGNRVEVSGKNLRGTVAFVGTTQFSAGKWVGVALDESQGKNDGSVNGKRYFTCPENHGLFVRQTQLTVLPDSKPTSGTPSKGATAPSSAAKTGTPAATPSGLKKPTTLAVSKSRESLHRSRESLLDEDAAGGGGGSGATLGVDQGQSQARRVSLQQQQEPQQQPSKRQSMLIPPSAGIQRIPASQSSPMVSSAIAADPAQLLGSSEVDSTQRDAELAESNQIVDNLRAEVADLQDKLDTLKRKRAEDKDKLKEGEKARLLLQQLEENKRRMAEQNADLQRQLVAAKAEATQIREAFDRYKEDMADVSENMELATLDKEMAEERADELDKEVESLKQRVEELTLENDILREEAEGTANQHGVTPLEVKQLQEQNTKLKEGLVKFRDLSNQDKQELQVCRKECKELRSEVDHLRREKSRALEELAATNEKLIELQEQVDAALGAEEMVSTLTEKNLTLEERVEQLAEEKEDLEQLCEMNDELLESSRETESGLREQLELRQGALNELKRMYNCLQDSVRDYETTIGKFRDLVKELQDQNRQLQQSKPSAAAPEDSASQQQQQQKTAAAAAAADAAAAAVAGSFDFKSHMAETRQLARLIDSELRELDAAQNASHVKLLCAFLPESFARRGGDHDCVLICLLMTRLASKCDLLCDQLKEKFGLDQQATAAVAAAAAAAAAVAADAPEASEVAPPSPTPATEQQRFAAHLRCLLGHLRHLLGHFQHALSTCSPELLVKLASLFPELLGHEAAVDQLIEQLRKGALDENCDMAALERLLHYMDDLYRINLAALPADPATCLRGLASMAGYAGEAFGSTVDRMKACLPSILTAESQAKSLFVKLTSLKSEFASKGRSIRRRLPADSRQQPLRLPEPVRQRLDASIGQLSTAMRALQHACREMHQAPEFDSVTAVVGFLLAGVETVYDLKGAASLDRLDKELDGVFDTLQSVCAAVEHGEFDFDGTKTSADVRPTEPVLLRAQAFRKELADNDILRGKLEAKDTELKELVVQIKQRQQDLSEATTKLAMVEKRLETTKKEYEDRCGRLQVLLEQTESQLKKKTAEFEQTLEALQSDIDSLESERHELRDKLKSLSKKNLLEGLTSRVPAVAGQQPGAAAAGAGASSGGGGGDSSHLQRQLEAANSALQFATSENARLRSERLRRELARLKPLAPPPRKPTGLDQSLTGLCQASKSPAPGVPELWRRSCDLAGELKRQLLEDGGVGVVQLTHPRQEPPERQLAESRIRLAALAARVRQVAGEVASTSSVPARPRLAGERRPTPGPAFEQCRLVGRLRCGQADSGEGVVRVALAPEKLQSLHVRLLV
ncbi:hypothetical protein BOX15_Mlig027215g2 [Macrostomum lignano]|uniref:Dynactin subunit 1 n=1 Tax=Macrostomum lignano TaxID=282301 RepID=A0A267DP72_9PLAT|nr:hypothetical protein BOX15_Mlig027215g2 [Macrostomum lignano]